MNTVYCQVCERDYKLNSYYRHSKSNKHILNEINLTKLKNKLTSATQEQKIECVKTNHTQIDVINEPTTINKQEVINTLEFFYESFNTKLDYPDGIKLQKIKMDSIKKFINNLMKDERHYKNLL